MQDVAGRGYRPHRGDQRARARPCGAPTPSMASSTSSRAKAAKPRAATSKRPAATWNGALSVQYGGRSAPTWPIAPVQTGLPLRRHSDRRGRRRPRPLVRPQGGFRIDWTPTAADTFTLQGDDYQGGHAQPGAPDQSIAGATYRPLEPQLAERSHAPAPGLLGPYVPRHARRRRSFFLDTYDMDAQDGFAPGQHRTRSSWRRRRAAQPLTTSWAPPACCSSPPRRDAATLRRLRPGHPVDHAGLALIVGREGRGRSLFGADRAARTSACPGSRRPTPAVGGGVAGDTFADTIRQRRGREARQSPST